MPKRRIFSRMVAEPPAKTWSQCARVGNLIFISGQVGRRGGFGGPVVGLGNALLQSRQAFRNVKHLVEAAGGTMDDVVRLTVWLTDIRDRPALLEARAEAFRGDFPTVTLVGGVQLASKELLVEIDAIAVVDEAAPRRRGNRAGARRRAVTRAGRRA